MLQGCYIIADGKILLPVRGHQQVRPGGDHIPPPGHGVHREPPDHSPQRRPHPPRRGLRGRNLTPQRQSSMCLVWIIYDMVVSDK